MQPTEYEGQHTEDELRTYSDCAEDGTTCPNRGCSDESEVATKDITETVVSTPDELF